MVGSPFQGRSLFRCLLFVFILSLSLIVSCATGLNPEPEPSPVPPDVEKLISAVKLIRLDGTQLDLTARPIPRNVSLIFNFLRPLTEAEKTLVESAITVLDPDGVQILGTYTWSADLTNVIFSLAGRLEYQTEYKIQINESMLPAASFSKEVDLNNLKFTTLTARDVNGDGYSDALVAGISYPESWGKGIVYIIYGSADGVPDCDISGTCIPDTTIIGGADGDQLGYSLSMAGDVNADGYVDVIISAPNADVAEVNDGQVYIFYGSASGIRNCDFSAGCTADATITGGKDPDMFFGRGIGHKVSSAGDINGDGFDDIIINDDSYSWATSKGRVYIFYGSLSGIADCDLHGPCTAGATIDGEYNGEYFGGGASAAGDVNGDDYDDIILGTENYDFLPGINQGRAYIFHGSADGIANCDLSAGCTADAVITGGREGAQLGGENSLSTAGDVNADGYDDVIVGAWAYREVMTEGAAYVFLGSAAGVGDCNLAGACSNLNATFVGADPNSQLGYAVYTAGDVNADGYSDVLVSAHGAKVGDIWPGQAYLFYGSASGMHDCYLRPDGDYPCTADVTITGAEDSDSLGVSLSFAGDVNNDSISDVIVGADRVFYESDMYKGAAYVFTGSSSGIANCNVSGSCTDLNAIIIGPLGAGIGYVQ